jgi:hypothetical protein
VRKRNQQTAVAKAAVADPPTLLDLLWVRLLAAAWIAAIVLIYYRLQIVRLLQVLSR